MICFFCKLYNSVVSSIWTVKIFLQGKHAPYEVDFVIQRENDIIPIEAKAGINVKATSVKNYEKQYREETPLIVRLSLRNLSLDGKVLNVPLFMADQLDKIIDVALKTIRS